MQNDLLQMQKKKFNPNAKKKLIEMQNALLKMQTFVHSKPFTHNNY